MLTVAVPLIAAALAVKVTVWSTPQLVMLIGSGVAVTPVGVTTSSTRGLSPGSQLHPLSGSSLRAVADDLDRGGAAGRRPGDQRDDVPAPSMLSWMLSAYATPANAMLMAATREVTANPLRPQLRPLLKLTSRMFPTLPLTAGPPRACS